MTKLVVLVAALLSFAAIAAADPRPQQWSTRSLPILDRQQQQPEQQWLKFAAREDFDVNPAAELQQDLAWDGSTVVPVRMRQTIAEVSDEEEIQQLKKWQIKNAIKQGN